MNYFQDIDNTNCLKLELERQFLTVSPITLLFLFARQSGTILHFAFLHAWQNKQVFRFISYALNSSKESKIAK